jgi:hypothetical protein
MAKRVIGAALAVTLGAAALAGCGGGGSGSSNPTQTVDRGIQADLNQSGLRMVLHVQGTTSDLNTAGHPTQAQRRAILRSTLTVSVHSAGSTPISQVSATNGANAFSLSLADGNDDLVDLRYIGDNLYARVQITKLAADYGVSGTSAASFESALRQLSTAVSAARALENGQWVSVNVPAAETMVANQLHVSPSLLPHLNPGELIGIVTAFFSGLEQDSKVTSSATSQPYPLKINERSFAGTMAQALASAPGVSLIPNVNRLRSAAGSIPPNATAKVNANVSNGRLSRLELPAQQFGKGSKAVVVMDITTNPSITAPAGATPVNMAQVGALIGQLAKNGAGGL